MELYKQYQVSQTGKWNFQKYLSRYLRGKAKEDGTFWNISSYSTREIELWDIFECSEEVEMKMELSKTMPN